VLVLHRDAGRQWVVHHSRRPRLTERVERRQDHGAWTGTISGGGKLEFYASSDNPNPALVPATATGSAKPSSTTDWYKLFFPSGTLFGLTHGANAPWNAYDWTYAVNVTCGTNTSVAVNWNDGINPGDDGQGATDGNITGATACTS
jgi:hypothetical protein